MANRATAITGATGFLGKRLCMLLIESRESVIAVGRRFDRFPVLPPVLCQPRIAALEDQAALQAAFRGADTVIHAAALRAVWGRRKRFLRTNVEGTYRVLAAARAAGVRRVVFVSSAGVTFNNEDRFNVVENEPRPRAYLSHYQESKALAEDVIRGFDGIESVIIRPCGIFGPGDMAVLPQLLARAQRGKLRRLGAGANVVDIAYVDNVVDALLLARNAPGAAGQTYHVSNGEPVVLWDFIRDGLRRAGLELPRWRIPLRFAFALAGANERLHRAIPFMAKPILTRYTVAMLTRNYTLDISAARRDLGYRPKIPMSLALIRAVDDFMQRSPSGG